MALIKNIAVLGGGNGSLTMAGDMSLADFNVRMWTAFPEEFEKIYKTKTIKLIEPGRQGEARIGLVTKDLAEALKKKFGDKVPLSISGEGTVIIEG